MSQDSIQTGSHLNHRTFAEEDYWESFQSTIVSGQVMSVEGYDNDQTMFLEDNEEDNPLNMNLDAFADEEFFDCPEFAKSPANLRKTISPRGVLVLSPRPYRMPDFYKVRFSPEKNKASSNNINCLASPRKLRPTVTNFPSMHSPSISSESSLYQDQKTGLMLAQMINDFNDVIDHAQSTPRLSSDSGNPSSVSFSEDTPSSLQVRRTLDFNNAETIVISSEQNQQNAEVSVSNKENFYEGKYSKAVSDRKAMQTSPRKDKSMQKSPGKDKSMQKSPRKDCTRPRKVALMREFFEHRAINESTQSKTFNKSKIPVAIRKSSVHSSRVKKSPQTRIRTVGSPRYRTHSTFKLCSSRSSSTSRTQPTTTTTFSSSGSGSFLDRNQPKFSRTSRVQSCSDAPTDKSSSLEESCKSHSTGDLRNNSSNSIKASNSSKITVRPYLKVNKLPPLKVSEIAKRRSLQGYKSSPIKPVSELRKRYSPLKHAGNASKKQAARKPIIVPKIVISQL